MSAIKPGCLCYLVGPYVRRDERGRVVTAARYFPNGRGGETRALWEIEAPWLPPAPHPYAAWALLPGDLRPITDPDADMTADRKELLDLLLYAEQHPSTIPTLTEGQP